MFDFDAQFFFGATCALDESTPELDTAVPIGFQCKPGICIGGGMFSRDGVIEDGQQTG